MKRRDFVAGTGLLLASLYVPALPSAADSATLKQLVADFYGVYYRKRDKEAYRGFLTDDYLLLENGEIMDAAADIAAMPAPDAMYERNDSFDFRQVRIQGGMAYLVYFLSSNIKDKDGSRNRKWLESIILRRFEGGWRVALLHSTRIASAGT